ncbi:MAG: hypothetical protein J6Y63_00605 [Bacteroidales bacterium]|nr:hypothetical protein [Bacteroidales bacterium]
MKKVFGIFAVALALVACNKNEMDVQSQTDNKYITITAQLAPKSAITKALFENTTNNSIVVNWAKNEEIAILYSYDNIDRKARAEITSVDASGTATITFVVLEGTPNNTPCKIVYPFSAGTTSSASDADSDGVKDTSVLLGSQDGTLNSGNLDVRVGAGTIQTTTQENYTSGNLTVTKQPVPQFAIFKFTVMNAEGTANVNVEQLDISIGSHGYTIKPSSATSTLFAALPPVSDQTVTFYATVGSSTLQASKDNITFDAGKYYQSTVKVH